MARIFVYESLSAGADDGPAELLAAGRAMRDAIVGDLARLGRHAVTVAGRVQDAGHPGAHVRAVAALPGESAATFVHRQSRLHDLCWIVAPETDGLLLQLHEAVGDARWIGCAAEAIRVASSKRATCGALHAAGIATPLSFAERHEGAWIVKPDDGAGSLATRRHATQAAAEADLVQRLCAGSHALAEPCVEGEALSLSLVVGPEIARTIAINRQRIAIDESGMLHDLGVQPAAIGARDPRTGRLQALATQVAAALPGLRGYVGIDLVWNEREGPVVIEVNPRVTCAYVGLSAALGRNLAEEILATHVRTAPRDTAADATV